MGKTRYLLSHINLINIILTGVLIFLVNYMLLPFLNKSMQYSLPVIKKHEKTEPLTGKKQDQSKTPSPLDYMVITEQNLFHPERKIPVEVKEAQPLPKPDFVLYGTLISGDTNIAYMEDKKSPFSTPGRGKRQTPLKLGDSMSGFILKELTEDKATMIRGDERLLVFLNDPARPKIRTDAPTQILSPTTESKGKALPGEIAQPAQIEQPPQGIDKPVKSIPQSERTSDRPRNTSGFGGILNLLKNK